MNTKPSKDITNPVTKKSIGKYLVLYRRDKHQICRVLDVDMEQHRIKYVLLDGDDKGQQFTSKFDYTQRVKVYDDEKDVLVYSGDVIDKNKEVKKESKMEKKMVKITKIDQCKTGMKVGVVAQLNNGSNINLCGILHVSGNFVWVCHNHPKAQGSLSPDMHGYKYSWKVMNQIYHTIPNIMCSKMAGENAKPFVPVESKPTVKVYEWDGIEYTKESIGGISVESIRNSVVVANKALKKWNQLFGK